MGSIWHGTSRAWERFNIKKAWARSVLADAESERQNGTDGRWLVRHSSDFRFGGVLIRRAYYAGRQAIGNVILENS